MKNTKLIWDFVEAFYPNYSSCPNILLSENLLMLIENDFEKDSGPDELLNKKYFGNIDNPDIQEDYERLMYSIYEESINNFMNIRSEGIKSRIPIDENQLLNMFYSSGGFIDDESE